MRFARISFWLALTIWIGALISGGVAATGVFSILPDLGVQLDRFSAYPEGEHGRLAAGLIMEPVFTSVDVAQFMLAAIVAIAFIAELVMTKESRWRWTNLLRAIGLAVAVSTLAWRAAMIMPEMNGHLRAYRAAAESGMLAEAEAERTAFDDAHPVAARFMEFTLVSLLITVIATAAGGAGQSEPAAATRLEEPELLRKGS